MTKCKLNLKFILVKLNWKTNFRKEFKIKKKIGWRARLRDLNPNYLCDRQNFYRWNQCTKPIWILKRCFFFMVFIYLLIYIFLISAILHNSPIFFFYFKLATIIEFLFLISCWINDNYFIKYLQNNLYIYLALMLLTKTMITAMIIMIRVRRKKKSITKWNDELK